MSMRQRTRDGAGELVGLDTVKAPHDGGERHQVRVRFPLEVIDSYKTVFLPDTFREDLAGRLPAMAWMHNLREPIGRGTEHDIQPRHIDLGGRFSRFDKVPLAERAYYQLKDGDLTDFSFGFNETAPPVPWTRLRRSAPPGVMAFPKARMNEFSPVVIGSIPGAQMTGLRDELGQPVDDEDGLQAVEVDGVAPTSVGEVAQLARDGLLDRETATEWIRMLAPEGVRERIVVQQARHDPTADDGDGGDDGDDDTTPEQAAQAVDAALDAAQELIDGLDDDVRQGLPDDVRQALDLVSAAGMAADELLDSLGLPDTDDDDGASGDDGGQGTRGIQVSSKPWSNFGQGDYTPAQWKQACLVDTGKGDPDSKDRYSLPVKEPDGTVNKNALAAAAGRLNQVQADPAKKKAAAKALLSLYGQAGMKAPGGLLQATRGDFAHLPDDEPEPDEGQRQRAVVQADALALLDRVLARR